MPQINTHLRTLVDLRGVVQKQRMAFGNRMDAIFREADVADEITIGLLERWHNRFLDMESDLDKEIKDAIKDVPIINLMTQVKGVGPLLSARVVAMIDIEKSDTVSALWRYCGYGVTPDGTRERPTKGEKLHYNTRLKSSCYNLGRSMLRTNSPYRSIYDSAKAYYEANRPDWTKAHRDMAALRKMVKIFLSHLWLEWRTLEGLPVRNLYVEEYRGHTHILRPQEFGWPAQGVVLPDMIEIDLEPAYAD